MTNELKGPMPPQEVRILAEIFRARISQCGEFANKTEAIAHTIGSYVCAPVCIFADLQQEGGRLSGHDLRVCARSEACT